MCKFAGQLPQGVGRSSVRGGKHSFQCAQPGSEQESSFGDAWEGTQEKRMHTLQEERTA